MWNTNNSGKIKSKGLPINSSLVKSNKGHNDKDMLQIVSKYLVNQ